jgi:hypothetical protein
VDKAHLDPTKDAKRELYKTKGYNQDIRMQKLKEALLKKKLSCY